jgi:DNA-binding response OmpR family regulator
MTKKIIVLVIDDEHARDAMGIKLASTGYKAILVENGAKGFEAALDSKPDIIVTDHQLPVMTGLELVKKLRQHEETKDIPVIMLTTLTTLSFDVECREENALQISVCMSKPIILVELLGHIENVLRQKEPVRK